MKHDVRQLWELDAKAVVPLIIKLAEFQGTKGHVEPNEDDLANALGANGVLYGIGAFTNDDKLVGFCISYDTYSTNNTEHSRFLLDLFVDDDARGKGLAKALMSNMAKYCKEDAKHFGGYNHIYLHVLNWNKNAILFYEKLGGKITARIIKDDELWLEMKIPVENLL